MPVSVSGVSAVLFHLRRPSTLMFLRNVLRHRLPLTRRTVPRLRYRTYATDSTHKKNSGTPSVWAMVAVASMGFAAYSMLVKSREGQCKSSPFASNEREKKLNSGFIKRFLDVRKSELRKKRKQKSKRRFLHSLPRRLRSSLCSVRAGHLCNNRQACLLSIFQVDLVRAKVRSAKT